MVFAGGGGGEGTKNTVRAELWDDCDDWVRAAFDLCARGGFRGFQHSIFGERLLLTVL